LKIIQIDKKRLIEEHKERKNDFYEQLALLQNSLTETNWELVKELKLRMKQEIKTKA